MIIETENIKEFWKKSTTLFDNSYIPDFSVSDILSLLPEEKAISLNELLEKVHLLLDDKATLDYLKTQVQDAHIKYGLNIYPGFEGTWSVSHSEQSRYVSSYTSQSFSHSRDRLNKVIMAGYGKLCNKEGKTLGWNVCSADHTHAPRPVKDLCNRRECPSCFYDGWIRQATKRITRTTDGLLEAIEEYVWKTFGRAPKLYKWREVNVSPNGDAIDEILKRAWTLMRYDGITTREGEIDNLPKYFMQVYRGKINQIHDDLGNIAGIHIPHFHRIKKEYQEYAQSIADYHNKEKQTWERKWNRYDTFRSYDDWYDFTEFSPHSHLFIYGWMRPVDQVEKLHPGWKIINTEDKHKKENKKTRKLNIKAKTPYLLTHTPVIKGVDAYYYLGYTHSSKFRTTVHCQACGYHIPGYESLPRRDRPVKCPECEKDLIQNKLCKVCGEKLVRAKLQDPERKVFKVQDDTPVYTKLVEYRHHFTGIPPPEFYT